MTFPLRDRPEHPAVEGVSCHLARVAIAWRPPTRSEVIRDPWVAGAPDQPSAAMMSGTACSIVSITLVSYSTHWV